MSDETITSVLDALPPLPKAEIYFEPGPNRYWKQDASSRWIPIFKEDIMLELHKLKFPVRPIKGETYSLGQMELGRIRMEQNIVYAGPVAGQKPGLHTSGPHTYLVTSGASLIEPKEGSWDNIRILAERLFGPDQIEYVLGWSKNAVGGLYSGQCKPGQLLAMAGPHGCGKSFWQNRVITPMLGGRAARPLQYMTGQTSFNEDLIQSEHLLLEDENSKIDITSRRAFGAAIKNFTVNVTQRMHAKGRDAFVVQSSHWMSLSVNDEPENLCILPPMDESIADKIILLKCREAINMEWPAVTNTQKDFEPLIAAELPAFIHYLLHEHRIPVEIADLRFGVKAYQNKELANHISNLSPESELESLVDACFAQLCKEGGKIQMTANELQNALENHPDTGRRAQRLLHYYTACASYLGKLASKNPQKFGAPSASDRPRKWVVSWAD